MLDWYWRYIPCKGVKLSFDEFPLYPNNENAILHLKKRPPGRRGGLRRKHITEDDTGAFKNIDGVDFEISLRSESGNGVFDLSPAHVFSFLLMIKTTGWINAPALLSRSIFEEPDADVFCWPFIEANPTHYRDTVLTLKDAVWIQEHMHTGLRLVDDPIFQNAMQALTSFHCVPYANTCLLVAWSGLEALFRTNQEVSFRLSLYIANYLEKGPKRVELFERLRRSYDTRSKVTHGSGGKIANLHENAEYTREILCRCLEKCVEDSRLPDVKHLVFSE